MNTTLAPDELCKAIQTNPGLISTTVTFRDGTPVVLRALTTNDVQILGDYFVGLSAETKRRYGPHPFDRATAEQLCAEADPSSILRLLGIVQGAGGEQVVAYFILIMGIREGDAQRYDKLGLPLHDETDCTLAPSVADAYQSKGLGSLIMPHLLDVARCMGRKRMVLWGGTQATNDRGIHFYHKHGFRTVGEFEEPPGYNNYDMILDM
jgi:GNAT superfamily N-acetyltransferase